MAINNVVLVGRLTAAPEVKQTMSQIAVCSFTVAVDSAYKSGEDRQAEAEGRLIELPCKVGDTVYQTDGVNIYESTILEIMHRNIYDTNIIMFDDEAIGESIYLTREAAEAALKKVQG